MCIKCTKDNRDYKSCKTRTMKLARSQNRPKFWNFSNSSSPAAEPFYTSITRPGGKRFFSESPVGLLRPKPSQRSHHCCWDQNPHVDSAPSFLFSGTGRFYRLPARRKNTVSASPTAETRSRQSERLWGGQYCLCLSCEITRSAPGQLWSHCVEATGGLCRYPVILHQTRWCNLSHVDLVVIFKTLRPNFGFLHEFLLEQPGACLL